MALPKNIHKPRRCDSTILHTFIPSFSTCLNHISKVRIFGTMLSSVISVCVLATVVSLAHGALPSLRTLERSVKELDRSGFAFPRCVCTIHTLENGTSPGVKLMSLAYRRYASCNLDQDCKKRTADCPDFCREMGLKFMGKNAQLSTVLNETSVSIGSEMCKSDTLTCPEESI